MRCTREHCIFNRFIHNNKHKEIHKPEHIETALYMYMHIFLNELKNCVVMTNDSVAVKFVSYSETILMEC